MYAHDYIIKQLVEQEIEFDLLQSKYDPSNKSPLSRIIKQWKQVFIAGKYAPYLKDYLWHIFSYKATEAIEGVDADIALLEQVHTNTYIFNEPQQYLIECHGKIPQITMDDFFDDIYLCHQHMKWTYVIPHEIPGMGPYFAYGY